MEQEARTKLVLGLGNPGARYRGTRHNVGFRVVEELARRRSLSLDGRECASLVAGGDAVMLAQPQTYMNRSGWAARCLVERHGFEPGRILVVFDEINLPLGRLRLRRRGSPGGHRGMESIVENLATDGVPRLRLGVAGPDGPPASEDLVNYVLAPFAADEEETVREMIERAANACEVWLQEGAEAAMQRFNE